VSLTWVAATASAGPAPVESVDALMQDYAGDVPGASVLVARDGMPVLERSYGLANLEQATPADSITNYRLASVTKQFTAAAVMLLVEDGRVDLDDSIRQWLPSLPAVADAVTLRHLLVHGSGLIDYEDVMPQGFVGQLRDADVMKILQTQQHTYFTPGTAYRYSNSGYALLALVVERASDMSFPQFLQKRIFEPLGMTGTLAFVEGDAPIMHRAFGYSATGKGWEGSDQSPTSAVLGDGGVYSSIHDLAKWDAALYDSRLLSDQSRGLMFSPQVATDDPNVRYGFGWRISGDSLWHSGETTGFRNVIVRFPKQRLTVVVLSNRDAPEPHATAMAIARLFLEQNR
jgi:CubicO group peptidase (beta-lactamase class C family)